MALSGPYAETATAWLDIVSEGRNIGDGELLRAFAAVRREHQEKLRESREILSNDIDQWKTKDGLEAICEFDGRNLAILQQLTRKATALVRRWRVMVLTETVPVDLAPRKRVRFRIDDDEEIAESSSNGAKRARRAQSTSTSPHPVPPASGMPNEPIVISDEDNPTNGYKDVDSDEGSLDNDSEDSLDSPVKAEEEDSEKGIEETLANGEAQAVEHQQKTGSDEADEADEADDVRILD